MIKNILMITVLMTFLSCNTNSNSKSEKRDNDTVSKEGTIGPEQNAMINQEKKVETDPSFITCDCPKPYTNAPVQLRIDYSQGYIKLCTWFYDGPKKDINEFQFFDKNNNLIFEGYPPSEYKVISINKPLTIKQMTTLPGASGDWELAPVYDIEVIETDSTFEVNTKFIFSPPKLDLSFQDSIYQIFKQQNNMGR